MTRKSIYFAILTMIVISLFAGGVLAQGKHGKKKGHDNGNRGGKHEKQWSGNRGNDDARGRGKSSDRQVSYAGPRAYQQQVRQQQVRQRQVWQQQGQDDRDVRRQRQNERFARKQQKQYERDVRRQERQQQRIYQEYYDPRPRVRDDNGLHLGWYKNGKAYNNGVPWKRSKRDHDRRKVDRRDRRSNVYHVYDPIVTYLPDYQQPYYDSRSRENFVRSLISGFLGQPVYYDQPYEVYEVRPSYVYREPYRYSTVSYSPVYYDEPYYANYNELGGNSLQSSLLNIGLEMLQGFLGTGYSQGMYDAIYVRETYGPRYASTYYEPYDAPAAYYSPYVSCLADERRLFEEGYRLGYQDAMRDRDAYDNYYAVNNGDIVTEFLAATLIDRL